ncbi:glutamine-synthetase adenylyltransferase [Psychromarinibacter sp. C21-152]|uniref:Glutamine-synthetase adenylyltransferase n=1 Tax=Psychromarinibacter sediminicola TaxID=3033385 RepID=A0AAE3NNG4_9RHOB|nr:glutamine-synthetase adenylyltransferase [Psychromarinibacter sediminicola]MDF0599496.1 glutamine-synthetase adenylyltransferase [Psychromarinibacter sediminicola]
MSLAARITRCPRPFDPDRGAEAAALFPDAASELRDLLSGTGGCSPYLAGLIEKERDWLAGALDRAPEDSLAAILADTEALDPSDLSAGLRRQKRRAALLVALADLSGAWTLEETTAALTDFADRATDRALKTSVAHEIRRGKLPGATEDDAEDAAGTFALAMGKMGAHELNYSSDIDLIVLFDGERHREDYHEARAALVRATRKMAALLSEITSEGYVFRTDLRLRPDASVTPVCLSMEAAESYYESVGRTWERAAYVKARPCAGAVAAGERFLDHLTPFVWRKHLDFAAIQDAHDMRLRIRAHKGLGGPITLDGHDMKLGRGGIREIEFFTQTRQIIAGGRDRSLRVRGTAESLARLATRDWIPQELADTLTDHYRFHREVEHRVQMIADAQTHELPGDAEGWARLAAFMDRDEDDLRTELLDRLSTVHERTEGFFAPGETSDEPDIGEETQAVIDRWHSYPALRSSRAREIFERLKPDLLGRLNKAARPQEALEQFDAFLQGLPAGVQLFSLFEANPQLIDLIVDIAATAPALAQYLGRNAQVFDAVIGGAFFDPWPGAEALTERLGQVIAAEDDYERKLDAARRWQKEWRFRIGVHHLRGLIDAAEAGQEYADLAQAVLAALWPPVVAEFAAKHGDPPGRGAAVFGMGSLGARQLTVTSDLDIIVIYDAEGADSSDGRRPLGTRPYYARLTQAFVTALTAPMAEGTLYEVDMRLRPSGRQGPVAASWTSFQAYQRDEAWTWEHLALTRARFVAGAADLGADIESFRKEIIAAPRDAAQALADVADMRRRLAEAKPAESVWEAKRGPGRMQDIDLLAQAGALLAGDAAHETLPQLAAGQGIGWLRTGETERLATAYRRFWQVQAAARLLTGAVLKVEELGEGGQDFLLRQTGAESFDGLAAELTELADEADRIVTEALTREVGAA